MPSIPSAGTQLGRYQLEESLGTGACGVVFRAHDSLLDTTLCLKVLHPSVAHHPEIIARFKRELLLSRRVAHPGICRPFDLHVEGGFTFLSMEFVEGRTLRDVVVDAGRLPVGMTLAIGRALTDALAAAHEEGIVHRDLKPRNIMIRGEAEPVILDFGIATALDVPGLTRPGVPLGTRHYISPEVWRGDPATHKSDQFAIGVILYICLTGRLPFKATDTGSLLDAMQLRRPTPPSAVTAGVGPDVDDIVLRALAFEPKDRFPTTAALRDALDGSLAGLDDNEGAVWLEKTKVDTLSAPNAAPSDPTRPKASDPLTSTVPAKKDAASEPTLPPRKGGSAAATDEEVPPSHAADATVEFRAPVASVSAPSPSEVDSFDDEASWILDGEARTALGIDARPFVTTEDAPEVSVIRPPPSETEPVPRPTKRRRGPLLVAAGALGLVAIGAVALWSMQESETDAPEPAVAAAPAVPAPAVPAPEGAPEVGTPPAPEVAPPAAPEVPPPAPEVPPPAPEAAAAPEAPAPAPEAAPPDDTAAPEAAPAEEPEPAVHASSSRRSRSRARRARTRRRSPRAAPVDPAKSAFEDAARALAQRERARGIRRADLPLLGALHQRMRGAARRGDYAAATKTAREARDMVDATQVNKSFVQAKLARFNRAFDASGSEAAKKKAGTIMLDVMKRISRGDYAGANARLNAAFAKLGR